MLEVIKFIFLQFTSPPFKKGVDCHVLHGGHCQESRDGALNDFRDGTTRLLFATDLASRGIDVVDVTHVFNYDFPRDIEEYVHRVGRTGRAGRDGKSVTLMTWKDGNHAKKLIEILEEGCQPIPPDLLELKERHQKRMDRLEREGGGFRGRGRGGRGGRGGFRNRYRDADSSGGLGWD
jgi:ATP-dependent RNA helicase DDX43